MIELKDIATIAGKGGLFKILSPTRTGAVLESLDDKKKKTIINGHAKVSILAEISIYTTDTEGVMPLADVLRKVHAEFDGDTGLTTNSDPGELRSFMKFILPSYDAERVYVSDIKKLVSWYAILAKEAAHLLAPAPEGEAEAPEA